MDVQVSDGRGMPLKYLTSYVTEMHDIVAKLHKIRLSCFLIKKNLY